MSRLRFQLRAGAAAAAVALLASACGSSSGGSAGSGGSVGAGGGGAGAVSGTAAAHAAAAPTVKIRSAGGMTFLTDQSGKALYLFASDTSSRSTCTGACLRYWPVLQGTAKAGNGVAAAKLGSITTNGVRQVTYAGHPLYYYAGDSAPGQTSGQGLDDFGAKWWLVSPAGNAITGSSAPKAPASSGGGGGYYGGG